MGQKLETRRVIRKEGGTVKGLVLEKGEIWGS